MTPACRTLDLRYLRPSYNDNPHGADYPLQLRLCAQIWHGEHEAVVDCCTCDAIELRGDAPLISMAELVYQSVDPSISEEEQSEAARIFAENLRKELGNNKLVCIMPDAATDFGMGMVRNQLHSHFSDVDFLPASLATIFDWQIHTGHTVQSGDLIIVVDTNTATPVRAIRDKQLQELVWERHPREALPIGMIEKKQKKTLEGQGLPSTLADFPRWNGLEKEAGHLWVREEGNWHAIPAEQSIAPQSILDVSDIRSVIDKIIEGFPGSPRPVILSSSPIFRGIDADCNPCRGALEWNRRQQAAPSAVLWYDYLPQLSMQVINNGRFELFPLINAENHRIAPRRGETLVLPIKQRFTLAANKKSYHFPLFEGTDGKALRFQASVHSSAFPLKKNTECTLRLTYTYGAETPFHLRFEGPFGSAKATWESEPAPSPERRKSAIRARNKPYSLEQLTSWVYTLRNNETINLLDKLCDCLDVASHAHVGKLIGLQLDHNNQLICRVKVGDLNVRCAASDFCEPIPATIRMQDSVFIAKIVETKKISRDGEPYSVYWGKAVTFTHAYHLDNARIESPTPYPEQTKVILDQWKGRQTDDDLYLAPQSAIVKYKRNSYFVPASLIPSQKEAEIRTGQVAYCCIPKQAGKLQDKLPTAAFLTAERMVFPQRMRDPLVHRLLQYTRRIWKYRQGQTDLPKNFTKRVQALCQQGLRSPFSGDRPNAIKLFIACTGHLFPDAIQKGICQEVIRVVLDSDDFSKYPIALLMGDLSFSCQQALFDRNIRKLAEMTQGFIWQQLLQGITAPLMETLLRQLSTSNSDTVAEKNFNLAWRIFVNHIMFANIPANIIGVSTIEIVLKSALRVMFQIINICRNKSEAFDSRFAVRKVKQCCSALFFLLGTLNSSDRDVRILLCPHSPWSTTLLEVIKQLHNALLNADIRDEKHSCAIKGMQPGLFTLYVLLSGNPDGLITIDDERNEDDDDLEEDL